MRMHEDRRLIQNMKFIKRLEDDGQQNLVWHPRAKELMDIEDNMLTMELMDRAELSRLKQLRRKPRPSSMI